MMWGVLLILLALALKLIFITLSILRKKHRNLWLRKSLSDEKVTAYSQQKYSSVTCAHKIIGHRKTGKVNYKESTASFPLV